MSDQFRGTAKVVSGSGACQPLISGYIVKTIGDARQAANQCSDVLLRAEIHLAAPSPIGAHFAYQGAAVANTNAEAQTWFPSG